MKKMTEVIIMSKHKKNKRTIPYRNSGIVKYGSDKYVLMLILFYPIIITIISKESFHIMVTIYLVCSFIYIPYIIIIIFLFPILR